MSEEKQKEWSPERFRKAMLRAESGDNEVAHANMDELMCQALRDLGYGAGIDIFDGQDKWYA